MRSIALLLILAVPTAALAAKPKKKSAESKHAKALELYDMGRFAEAAKLFVKELPTVEALSNKERDLRELIVLSLFSANDKEGAKAAYATLIERFPSFRFDPERVFPETIAYFESAPVGVAPAETPPPAPVETPAETLVVAPVSTSTEAPRQIEIATPPPKVWHWYYLTPLGIGQFLAGSPVRGTLFLVAEIAFITLNVVGYVLLQQQKTGRGNEVLSTDRAYAMETMMNVGAFGLMGTAALGIVDGALERGPP